MHPPAARQTPQKGQENSPMDLALHNSDVLASTQTPQTHQNHDPQSDTELEPSLCEEPQDDELPDPLPLMHFPHCRLEISTFPTPNGPGKLEQIALPGSLVRTLLSRFETDLQQHQEEYQYQQQRQQYRRTPSPSPATSKPHSPPSPQTTTTTTTTATPTAPRPIRIQPHFDDAADWVFSRCLLADFTGFREDEAEALSTAAAAGRLCCWASVVLSPPRRRRSAGVGGGGGGSMGFGGMFGEDEEGDEDELVEEEEGLRGLQGGESGAEGEDEGRWELEFVVQRVGVRDPGSGWCECF